MANQVLYGFYNRRDLLDQRVTNENIPEFNQAIDATLAEHQRQFNAFVSLFADRSTDYTRRYRQAIATRNQPLDENGRARPIKRAGYYDIAFPIWSSGNAWGADYITRAKMTGQEVNDILGAMITGDIRWMRDQMLAALYADASWTFPDPEWGSLTIQGAANGDSVKYLIMNGSDAGATDDHILAQASSIDNSNNPFDNIYTDLTEHPENSGQIISLIPTNLKADVEALTAFTDYDDPDITPGDDTATLTGTLGVSTPGTVIGKANKVWIVEWPSLPDNYIISVASDGPRPLVMREDPEEELRGFNRVAERDDYPFYESQYLRRAGFGGQNRVAWRVDRIGNGTYAVPTGYTNPMS